MRGGRVSALEARGLEAKVSIEFPVIRQQKTCIYFKIIIDAIIRYIIAGDQKIQDRNMAHKIGILSIKWEWLVPLHDVFHDIPTIDFLIILTKFCY